MTGLSRTATTRAWTFAYWLMWVAFLLDAALKMSRVHAGFLTNHLADLTVPPALYMVSRGLAPHEPSRPFRWFMQWVGHSPGRAAAFYFLASTATEVSQIAWPRGVFAGTFDPWDIAAYGAGLLVCYVADTRRTPAGA